MSDEKVTELSETGPTEQEVEQPEKYTDEWYDSVEKRFKDLGEFIRSGKATHGTTTESQSASAPAATRQGQSTSDAEADGTVGEAAPARDTRPPKPNHFWFRRLGE